MSAIIAPHNPGIGHEVIGLINGRGECPYQQMVLFGAQVVFRVSSTKSQKFEDSMEQFPEEAVTRVLVFTHFTSLGSRLSLGQLFRRESLATLAGAGRIVSSQGAH